MSTSFADLGVPAALVASLDKRGITAPFPIQAATLPDAIAGRDVCGKAPTGSGKTLAFGIPLTLRATGAKPNHPKGLVLVPTRELAAQVCEELEHLLGRDARVAAIYGGTSYDTQRRLLRRGADIVVACPGRLEDLVSQRVVVLDEVEVVVLDEADRMADMGFLPAVKRVLDACTPNRQTLLFSATLDGDIDVLIRRYQQSPARHEVAGDEDSVGDVQHVFWKTDRESRIRLLADVIRKSGRAVVFSRTKHGADRLAKQLETAGVTAVAIHGDRSQSQRMRALAQFTDGAAMALVATDVAARGIHIDQVGCVVHFDPPADHKDYVHRSGRTGRAGNDGTVVSLVMHEQVKAVRLLQRSLGFPQTLTPPSMDVVTVSPPVTPKARPKLDRPQADKHHSHRSGKPAGFDPRKRRPKAAPGRPGGVGTRRSG
jgi:superfamily II DNA/RNA helicase